MRHGIFRGMLLAAFLTALIAPPVFGGEAAPLAVVDKPVHNFGAVYAGEKIYHSFEIRNKGDDTLVIEDIKSGWGCTTVESVDRIPPGEVGKIKLKVSTSMSSRAHQISKTVQVKTNDAKHPRLVLKITGRVKAFVQIQPRRVSLVGTQGRTIEKSVRIIPQVEDGFNVVKVRAMRGTDISFRLEDIRISGKKAYALYVKNERKRPGRYYDKIFLKTDSKIADTIPIIVSGHIRAADQSKQKTKQ